MARKHKTRRAVTLADLRRQLEKTGYLPIEDAYAIVDAVSRSDEVERERRRRKKPKKAR
jgi:hypothetical protein